MLGAEVLHVESTKPARRHPPARRPALLGARLVGAVRASSPASTPTRRASPSTSPPSRAGTSCAGSSRPATSSSRTTRRGCSSSSGFDVDAVRAIRPDVVLVRMPGFGLDGPWRDDPAFAFVIEDAAGLTWMTGYPDDTPISPYCVGDSNAGTHALCALLLALEHRRRTGEGVLVEASMVDAALNVAAEQIVEHAAYGAVLQRDGNRGPAAAPQNLYLAADADDDGRARQLGRRRRRHRRAVAGAARGARPARSGPSTRPAHRGRSPPAHDAIDRHLAGWCARAQQRRDRRAALGRRRPGGQGAAAPRAGRPPPAPAPRLLRGRRPPGRRHRPPQHPALPVLAWPRAPPPQPGAAARRAHRRGAREPSASPTTSWPSSASSASSAASPTRPRYAVELAFARMPHPLVLRPGRGLAGALDRAGLGRHGGGHGRGRLGHAGRADLPEPGGRHPAPARA